MSEGGFNESSAKRTKYLQKKKSDRDLLYRLGNIPPVETDKLASPEYMPKKLPVSKSVGIFPTSEDKYTHYTIDGFPRRNFKRFY